MIGSSKVVGIISFYKKNKAHTSYERFFGAYEANRIELKDVRKTFDQDCTILIIVVKQMVKC